MNQQPPYDQQPHEMPPLYLPPWGGYNEPTQQGYASQRFNYLNNTPIPPPPPSEAFLPSPTQPTPLKKQGESRIASVLSLILGIVLIGAGIFGAGVYFGINGLLGKAPSGVGAQSTTSSSSRGNSQSIIPDYTASDIVSDFQSHNLGVVFAQYGETIYGWSGDQYETSPTAQSSVSFFEPSGCNGACDGSPPIGLWVYLSKTDAHQAYTEAVQDIQNVLLTPPPSPTGPSYGPMTPNEVFTAGRCLMMSQDGISSYVLVMNTYCV